MLQQVESKIQELKKLRAEQYYKKKDEDLSSWGLTSKKNGKKVTPIIVTDDEYEELIKASNGVGSSTRNSTANLLKTLSIVVIVLGFLGGIALWFSAKSLGFVWFTVALIASAVVAVLFKGIAEAISLLQQLLDMNPIERPDPMHARQQSAPAQPANMYTQPPVVVPGMAQPPIYQASSYRAPAQPYYGTPIQVPVQPVAAPVQPTAPVQPVVTPVQPVAPVAAPVAPVAPVAPASEETVPAYGAPQNYNETSVFQSEAAPDFSEIR